MIQGEGGGKSDRGRGVQRDGQMGTKRAKQKVIEGKRNRESDSERSRRTRELITIIIVQRSTLAFAAVIASQIYARDPCQPSSC